MLTMIQPSFYQVNHFLHIVTVSLWLGLTLTFSFMVVPLIRNLPDEIAREQMKLIGRRARLTVVVLMIFLIGTGLVNLQKVGLLSSSRAWTTTYGLTAMVKISLALVLFGAFPFLFVLVHRYGSDELDDRITRMNYLHWGISLITLVIMFLGVLLNG